MWPGSYCPNGHPHYMVEIEKITDTDIFQCRYCGAIKALPRILIDPPTITPGKRRHHDSQAKYNKFLADRPRVERYILSKLAVPFSLSSIAA